MCSSVKMAKNILFQKNSYGFKLSTKFEKRIGFVEINTSVIKNEDKELQKKLISYLSEHNNLEEKVIIIKPVPLFYPNLTKFTIDGEKAALQVKRDIFEDFFNSLKYNDELQNLIKGFNAEMNKDIQNFEQENQALKEEIAELQKKVDYLQEENNNLKEQKEKARADGVHKTYTVICCLLWDFILSLDKNNEMHKWKKEKFRKLVEDKVKDMYSGEVFTGKCFTNFWKIFPEKYKVGSGNPKYKDK